MLDNFVSRFTEKPSIVAIDTETTGLNIHAGDRPYFVSMTNYDGDSIGIMGEVDPFTREVSFSISDIEYVVSILTDASITKIFHNAKFDVGMLEAQFGVKIAGPIRDTLIYAHVADSSREMGLKPLAKGFGIEDDDLTELKVAVTKARAEAKKKGFKIGPVVETDYWLCPFLCAKYGITDTERTMVLYWFYETMYKVDDAYRNLVDMEHKVLFVTKRMEDAGVGISKAMCAELSAYYTQRMLEARAKIDALGFKDLNLNSPKQLIDVFFNKLGLPEQFKIRKAKDGSRKKTLCVDSAVLEKFAKDGIELAGSIVAYKEAAHQLTSFIHVFLEEGVDDGESPWLTLHPNYKTCGPITGRLSCTKPNLMNISNPDETGSGTEIRVRECFVPRGDDMVFYFTDYAQIEVWLAMFLSKDPVGMKALLDGADMHGNMARRAWPWLDPSDEKTFKKWRKRAKFIMFGLIYGAGVGVIKDIVGCDDTEANRIRDVFWDTYKQLYVYSQKLSEEADRTGFITNPFGRKYHVDPRTPYKALNYMIQGTAAEIMKRALIDIDKRLTFRTKTKWPKARLLLTIHDETCVEAHKDDKAVPKIIAECMSGQFHKLVGIPVRMKCEVSIATNDWGHKETLNPQPILEE